MHKTIIISLLALATVTATEATGVTMLLDNKCQPVQHHDKELMQMSRSIW